MEDRDIAIRVEHLAKAYVIGHEAARAGQETFREALARGVRQFGHSAMEMVRGGQIVPGDETEEFWALDDVSFDIARGEVVGIVGRNGAGKSTLLKILSRITEPTRGRVVINGRVSSLLEVGTGFHPELTGRENIYLNGAILGMTRSEIRARFDEIVAFAEIERFLDTPVKRYSSGMYVRLAFSVAAHLEPEILIVDEVLAVGDAEFQKKCLGKMSDVASGGRTVLFVSHNEMAVRTLCTQAVYLKQGRLVATGPVDEVLETYAAERQPPRGDPSEARKITDSLSLKHVAINPESIVSGAGVEVRLTFQAARQGALEACALVLTTDGGARVSVIDLREHGIVPYSFSRGDFTFAVHIASAPLVEGTYPLEVYVVCDEFAGVVPELGELSVKCRPVGEVVPYSPRFLGVVTLQNTAAIMAETE